MRYLTTKKKNHPNHSVNLNKWQENRFSSFFLEKMYSSDVFNLQARTHLYLVLAIPGPIQKDWKLSLNAHNSWLLNCCLGSRRGLPVTVLCPQSPHLCLQGLGTSSPWRNPSLERCRTTWKTQPKPRGQGVWDRELYPGRYWWTKSLPITAEVCTK